MATDGHQTAGAPADAIAIYKTVVKIHGRLLHPRHVFPGVKAGSPTTPIEGKDNRHGMGVLCDVLERILRTYCRNEII